MSIIQKNQCCRSGSGIRDPVSFWTKIRNRIFRIPDLGYGSANPDSYRTYQNVTDPVHWLALTEGYRTFSSVFKDSKLFRRHKTLQWKSRFFVFLLLADGRIRIRNTDVYGKQMLFRSWYRTMYNLYMYLSCKIKFRTLYLDPKSGGLSCVTVSCGLT